MTSRFSLIVFVYRIVGYPGTCWGGSMVAVLCGDMVRSCEKSLVGTAMYLTAKP